MKTNSFFKRGRLLLAASLAFFATLAAAAAEIPDSAGWLRGWVAATDAEGRTRFTQDYLKSIGITPSMIKFLDYPAFTFNFVGHAQLKIPGINSLDDGMLFVSVAEDNIAGVAPLEDGSGWLITQRDRTAASSDAIVPAAESGFFFRYIPFNSQRLIGGHITGATGEKRKSAGEFSIRRTAVGTYELTIPNETADTGSVLLQGAELDLEAMEPLATRAYLSSTFANGKFTIQSRKTTASGSELTDASFYFVWVDNVEPVGPPAGPRFGNWMWQPVSVDGQVVRETTVAASSDTREVLVAYVDTANGLNFNDPITQQRANHIVVGRFFDSDVVTPLTDPFPIIGSPVGQITKLDVKYNPINRTYVVVASARSYTAAAKHVPIIGIVNARVEGSAPTVARAWAHDVETDQNYDDVSVAVSWSTGNFLVVAERAFAGEGEGTVGILHDKDGNRLTPVFTRLDRLQATGDEDDPDVIYLPGRDQFLYISNTDVAGGLVNRIVGSLVDTAPTAGGELVVRTEQPLSDGQPAGRAEGHPHAVLNPFNGQLITAYDAGNDTSLGDLSFFSIGAAPDYAFSAAQAEVPYLNGPAAGNPFRHQHPQMAVDTDQGVILVGLNARGSTVGAPNGWAFVALGRDGLPLPSQLAAPYYFIDTAAAIDNGANYHKVVYSPVTKNFIVAFGAANAANVHRFQVIPPSVSPELTITRNGSAIVITWPGEAEGFNLQSKAALSDDWAPSDAQVLPRGGSDPWRAETTASGAAKYFRLQKLE